MRTTINVHRNKSGNYGFEEPYSDDDTALKTLPQYTFLGTVELDIQEPKKLVTKEAEAEISLFDGGHGKLRAYAEIPLDALNPRIVYEVKE